MNSLERRDNLISKTQLRIPLRVPHYYQLSQTAKQDDDDDDDCYH